MSFFVLFPIVNLYFIIIHSHQRSEYIFVVLLYQHQTIVHFLPVLLFVSIAIPETFRDIILQVFHLELSMAG
jgi:hypothetical membrane protein